MMVFLIRSGPLWWLRSIYNFMTPLMYAKGADLFLTYNHKHKCYSKIHYTETVQEIRIFSWINLLAEYKSREHQFYAWLTGSVSGSSAI